jgi:hypothetical protein
LFIRKIVMRSELNWALVMKTNGHLERDPHADGIAVHQLARTVRDTVAVGIREAQQLAGRGEERSRAVGIARRHEDRAVRQSRQAVGEVQARRKRRDAEVIGVHAWITADGELRGGGIGEEQRGGDEQEQGRDQSHGSRTPCARLPRSRGVASELPSRKSPKIGRFVRFLAEVY